MEAVIAGVGVGVYAYKKHKKHQRERRSRDSEPVTHVIQNHYTAACVTSNVGVQQQYAAGAWQGEAVEILPDSKTLQYLRQATLEQLLAMLVDGVYSRDREKMDIPFLEAAYIEDARTEMYTKVYWTRMQGITDEEEKEVGLRHYLRRREPDNLANGCHNRFRLVIALRGTKLSSLRDLKDDIRVALYTLHCSKRYKATELLIEKIIDLFRSHYDGSASEICITGHSLGAAIALSIGRDLAKDPIKRYAVHCYNPPLLTVLMLTQKLFSIEKLKKFSKSCKLLESLYKKGGKAKQLGMMALATIIFNDRSKLEEEFHHVCCLIDWNPVFYVNKGDLICREYNHFYEGKDDLKYERRNSCILQNGVPIHTQALVARFVNRNAKYSSLVPSVDMFISKRDKACHKLKQWYTDPNLVVDRREFRLLHDADSSRYRYPLEPILVGMIQSVSSLLPSIRSLPFEEYPAMNNCFLSVQSTTCSLPPEGYPPMTNSLAPQPVMAYPALNTAYPPQVPIDYPSMNAAYPPQVPTGYPAMNTAYPPQVPMGYPAMNTMYPPQVPMDYPAMNSVYPPQVPMDYRAMNTTYDPPQVPMAYPAKCYAQSIYTGYEKDLFDDDVIFGLDEEILPGSAEAVVLD